jgi:hypothetical protein
MYEGEKGNEKYRQIKMLWFDAASDQHFAPLFKGIRNKV